MSRRITVPPRDTSAPVKIPNKSQRARSKKPSGVLNPRHTSAQELLYQRWSDEATAIEITFDDGSTLVGQLKDYDTYALHVQDSAGVPVLIFKQAVRSIRPQATDSVDTAPHSR